MTAWISTIDPPLVERRFGPAAVVAALGRSTIYVDPPSLDAAGRISAVVCTGAAPGRLSTPLKVAVRIRDGEVLDLSCACRHGRVCDHVIGLLVDVAYHPLLRAALEAGAPTAPLAAELGRVRAHALEARTLDERMAHWLPPRRFEDDFEMDVDVVLAGATDSARSALLLRHRRGGARSLLDARDVLAARLTPRHRRLVELSAPYHFDRQALVAVRGQATVLIHLLAQEIGIYANGFKGRVRFGKEAVRPRVEPVGERLVARWYGPASPIGDAAETFVFAGPFPYLWVPQTTTFHPIDPVVDLDVAVGMQHVPTLPFDPSSAAKVGRALLVGGRGLGVAFPKAEVFGLPPLERPSFELRLTGSPLDVRAELCAVYEAGKIPIGEAVARDPATDRDLDAEEQAVARVKEAGLVAEGSTFVAGDETAPLFWERLPALRASTEPRFEVLLGDALARTKVGPAVEVDVRIGTTAGWLEAELEFRAGALEVEIDRLHRALVEKKGWVVLSDGSLARIAEDVAQLVGEAAFVDRGRLPPHQFGRVARWIELADSLPLGVRIHAAPEARALRDRIRDFATRGEPLLPTRLCAELRPYQRVGIAWLQLLQKIGASGVLADDMGLGKTLMTLAFLARWKEDAGPGPTLVVCPTSVVGNWQREAARFTPDLRVGVWAGPNRKDLAIAEHDLVLTTYGLLRRDDLATTRFRCVVLDEAQNIKNPAAETSRAARRLDAAMRIALTGTPVENRLSELWSLMTFIHPGMLGTAADFDVRYERPIAFRPDGAVAAELRAVVRPFILRRTKAEVLLDLPPKTEIERKCVFGLRQKRLYDALALAVRQAVSKREPKRKNARTHLAVLTAILRLRQMACDPRLVDEAAAPSDSAKRAAFLDLVRELVAEDRRALVFSQFVELLTLWRRDLDEAKIAYEYLDGSTTNRDDVVDRFQRGTAPLFLISLKAGGAGLNLTAADTVIHCDPWWNPAVEDQATDRAHRIGQTRPVTVVRLVAEGTIEDKIALLKEKKEELAALVFGDRSGDLGRLTDNDLRVLLGDVDRDPDDEAEGAIDPG